MDTYAKPVKALIIFDKNQAEMISPVPFPLPIYGTVLFRFSEEGGFRQLKAHNNVPVPGAASRAATLQNHIQWEAERRLRPLARRVLMMERPALVLILRRKPWVRARFRLDG